MKNNVEFVVLVVRLVMKYGVKKTLDILLEITAELIESDIIKESDLLYPLRKDKVKDVHYVEPGEEKDF